MAFDYGSQTLGIRNPFRIEGTMRATRGLLVSSLGIYLLLQVTTLADAQAYFEAWASLGGGVVLLLWGLSALGHGLFQVMRFFVGRSVPTSLARNVAPSESHRQEPAVVYGDQDLEQMLMGRKNPTFKEPEGWLPRAVHSLFPNLLFLPYPYRNMAQRLAGAVTKTALALSAVFLAWFSATTGLTAIDETPVMDWFGVGLFVVLFGIWARLQNPLSRQLSRRPEATSVGGIVVVALGAVIAPFALTQLHDSVTALPAVDFPIGTALAVLAGLASTAMVLITALIALRGRHANPFTEVAEYRNNWQENVHPQDVFINFDSIVMANRRYREVPNRVYRSFDPNLMQDGGHARGSFSGEIIQETQPVYETPRSSRLLTVIKAIATLVAQLLLAGAAVYVSQVPSALAALDYSALGAAGAVPDLVEIAIYPLMLAAFGFTIQRYTHPFWAEMQFSSLIVMFQCDGTYTESHLNTGSSIYDSTESQNIVVRTSMTPWVIAANIRTATFSATGRQNLEFPRYVLEMHKAEVELDRIITEVRSFLDERRTIANVREGDLDAASTIHQLNEQTRGAAPIPDQSGREQQGRLAASDESGNTDPGDSA